MTSYIYKISSKDNKLHYYGMTTQTIQNRFNNHYENYIKYINNDHDYEYLTSIEIFKNYNILDITIQIIEEHTDIPIKQLRQRELYYIQNFTCVNIIGKNNYTIHDLKNYITLDNTPIPETQIKKNNIHIHNINTQIQHITQILGYTLQNNTLTHTNLKKMNYIKNNLIHALQQYYKIQNIDKNTHATHILDITNTILNTHKLQIIQKKIQTYFKKTSYVTSCLLLHNTDT
jgi:hypothetical protein